MPHGLRNVNVFINTSVCFRGEDTVATINQTARKSRLTGLRPAVLIMPRNVGQTSWSAGCGGLWPRMEPEAPRTGRSETCPTSGIKVIMRTRVAAQLRWIQTADDPPCAFVQALTIHLSRSPAGVKAVSDRVFGLRLRLDKRQAVARCFGLPKRLGAGSPSKASRTK